MADQPRVLGGHGLSPLARSGYLCRRSTLVRILRIARLRIDEVFKIEVVSFDDFKELEDEPRQLREARWKQLVLA